MKGSNALIGIINFITFLISIPILAGGIWLSNRANTDCLRFLQWPLIVIGVCLMVLSLMGFAGACYRLSWLLWLYLFAMFFVVAALVGFIIFAYAVTDKGEGQPVLGRSFLEYHLSDYAGWLRDRVSDPQYWAKISSCLRDARACRNMARYVPADGVPGLKVPESADMFYRRNLSPTEAAARYRRARLPQIKWRPVGFRPKQENPSTIIIGRVGVLQAADVVRVRVRERDGVEPRRGDGGGRPGLHPVEQRPAGALLRVRRLQGRRAGQPPPQLAQGLRHQHRPPHPARHRLRDRLRRLPQHPQVRQRRALRRQPHDQVPPQPIPVLT